MRLGWFWRLGWFHMIPPWGDFKILHGISGIGISESSHWIIASRALTLIPCGSNEIGGVTWHQWHPVAKSFFSMPVLIFWLNCAPFFCQPVRIETRNASDLFSSWRPLSMAALAPNFQTIQMRWDKNAVTDITGVTGDWGHSWIRNDHVDYVYGRSAVWASGFSPVGSDVRDEMWFQHLRSLKLVLSLRGRFKGLFHDHQAKNPKS